MIKSSDDNGVSFTCFQLDVSVHSLSYRGAPDFQTFLNQVWTSFSLSCADQYYRGGGDLEWNLEAI